ncbi:hypothetical protein BGW38_005489 [Lunasporangiospora selenospora]|uniref:Uncharacterized protein n=1 Tax=Lunasporangiospora selenospora TaxID=979761 RepID=A0A9P6KBC6_9FUNG|nr:hypothetical protein BGW38_005489 [Lunasporangiospora selenospora]
MTDISTDLYAILHQPLLDTTSEIGQLSPENPRFLRMYINKNRSVLSKCRDERFARVVILSDVQLGRPFSAPISTANTPNPGEATGAGRGNGKTGPGTGMISMVRMSARILIGKPIGERHEMVTVGDLDCPNAWMTVVCVKSVEIDMEVPAKFEKGILSKMRHEVVPYSSENKIAPEYQRAFADALGVLLPNSKKIGQAHGAIGQRAAIPAVAAAIATSTSASTPSAVSSPIINKGLGISTSTPSSPALTVSTPESTTSPPAQQKSATAGPPKTRTKSGMTEIIDQGPNKSLIVKIRLPVLKTITTPKVDESQVTTPSHDRPLPQEVEMTTAADTTAVETTAAETVAVDTTTAETTAVETTAEETTATETTEMMTMTTTEETPQEPTIISTETTLSEPPQLQHPPTDSNPTLTATQHAASTPVTPLMHSGATAGVPHSTAPKQHLLSSQILATPSWSTTAPSTTADGPETLSAPDRMMMSEQMTKRGLRMLEDLKVVAQERDVPYIRWNEIEPTLTVDTAHGLFKRIYHVRGDDSIVIQNFKEMDAESFEMRVREVACLLKLRGLEGVGQIQAVIDNEEDHLVGLSMTK